MVRTPINVDITSLRRIIKEVEVNGGLGNQSQLFKEVARRYNGMLRDIKMGATTKPLIEGIFPEITPSVVMLRIKENNIRIKTVPGKRGRPKGQKIVTSDGEPVKRVKRSDKFKNNPKIMAAIQELRKEFPEKEKWVDKIEEGSLIHGIKLHCYSCSGRDNSESLNCLALNCALFMWLSRKYTQ